MASYLLPLAAWAQQPQPTPAFDAASVKYKGQTPGRGGVDRDPGRVSYRNIRLLQLIMLAYGVSPDQIRGPSWLSMEHYDVAATIPAGTDPGKVPLMLQNLLAERFGLKVHREPRLEPVYALVIAPGGPKLTKAASQPPSDAPGVAPRRPGFRVSTSGRMELRDTTIEGLIRALSSRFDHPIVDQTGLEGTFDIVLDLGPGGASVSLEPSGPAEVSIAAALRNLGLRLEQQKANLDTLIVDNVRKIPTEN